MSVQPEKEVLAFVGSYTEASEAGVYVCRYNPEDGALTVTDHMKGLRNPTFLDVDPVRRILYVMAEENVEGGGKRGIAVSYRIDAASGKLTELNREPTVEAPTCHISLDVTRRCLFTASYHAGLMGLSPILDDGRIGPVAQVFQHTGSSILPAQTQSRIHSVFPDPNNGYAVVCDLGTDRIYSYKLDQANCRMSLSTETVTAPGAGPRHFAFHPHRPYGYVINELDATITAYAYGESDGTLTPLQTVPTLPEDFTGENSTADIHLSNDGKFLYGSNRGHDSIVVYAVDQETGRLSYVEHVPTEGGHPRNFALSLDGRFLLAANRDGDNIVTFERNAETGRLRPNGRSLSLPQPVCVKFAEFKTN